MYYDYADILRPLHEDNRDEYILVEFHRTLKNTNMSLLRNLFVRADEDPEILNLLPNLAQYATMSTDERYDATVQFNRPRDLIFNLSGEKLSEELCESYANAFMEPYKFEYLHNTRMELILHNLLKSNFVKKVYVFADKFTNEMKQYFALNFMGQGVDTRVVALEGDLEDCLLTMQEITTVFISNFSDLDQIYKSHPDAIKGKFIIISDGYSNLVPVENTTDQFQYAGAELFIKLHREKFADITYSYPHAIYRAI